MLKKDYQSQSTVFDSLGGAFLARQWTSICSQITDFGIDRVMNYGENVLLLLLNLRGCNSWSAALAAITMYIKMHCKDQSLCTLIMEMIKTDYFDDIKFDSQSGESINYQTQSNPFDAACSAWDSLKNSPAKAKILGLISTALAVGMISESRELAPTVKGLKLFRIYAEKKQLTMVDLVGTIISTMKFFVERGYKCFEEQSLGPLLYEDDPAYEFTNSYTRIMSNFEYVKVGTFTDTNPKCPWADEQDFERDLLSVISDCEDIRKSASKMDRVLLDRHYGSLLKIKTEFELLRTTGGLREAPFSFCIFGASGIGKSTIVNNLITYSLQRIMWERGIKDYEVDPNAICTLNEMDKYHSDYKSHIQAVLLDDFANAKADVTNVNPSVNVINFINNVARTAIMAEADLKGKIQINPKVVAATTNVQNLDAPTYSNEPVSILRRFQIHIEARVKDAYLKDQEAKFVDGKQLALDAANGDLCPDAWEFDVYEWIAGDTRKYVRKEIMYHPRDAQDGDVKKQANSIGMSDLLYIFNTHIKDHVKIQQSVVKSSKKIFNQKLCPHGNMAQYCPHCLECKSSDDYESQSNTFQKLYDEYSMHSSYTRWENYLPQRAFETFKVQATATFLNSRNLLATYFTTSTLMYMASVFTFPLWSANILAVYIGSAVAAMSLRKDYVISRLQESRDMLPQVVKNIRDMQLAHGKKLFYFCSAVITLYILYTQFIKMKPMQMDPQGNEFSVHMEQENVWAEVPTETVPQPFKESAVSEDLRRVIKKNQVKVRLGREWANGLFVRSNLLIVPNHMVPTDKDFEFESVYSHDAVHGSNFQKMLNKEDVHRFPKRDLALLWVSAGGPRKDLTSYFPTSQLKAKTMTYSVFNSGNEVIESYQRIHGFRQITTDRASFYGAQVQYAKPTFSGLCGATHVSNTSAASILGFHAAGIAGTVDGALTSITHDDLMIGVRALEGRSHILPPLAPGVMSTQAYGIDFTPSDFIPAKSPLAHQEKAQVTCYGTIPNGAVRPKSSVIRSPISKTVEDVTGVSNIYGPPANCRPHGEGIPSWEPYQKYISGVGNAYQEFPSDVMQWAIKDYTGQFDLMFKSPHGKELLSKVRVLDDIETTSGIDGMRFVDAMKANTSMGFPVNKKKEDYIEFLQEEHDSCSLPRIMDDETLKLAQRARELWLQGQRSYEVFKTCTKDEPTKLSKMKVRCFQAAPVSLQMNIRKYFLTMCHLFSMSSKTSECAVGINAAGRGWHELNEHMIRFGKERIVAGDFKAYDQHMSAGMVMASYKVFQHIATAAGFSEEDLKIMQGCATEVAYPVMSLNGELIQLYGSNPSGQNLTVYTNSIVNSLYHRCVFRILYPRFKGKFSDAVSLMSYGDDVKMSVSPDFPKYNHTDIQKVFSDYGIAYTMAEKEAESVPFISHEDADFLKRKSRWEPNYSYINEQGARDHGMWIAMLDQESIFKQLHSNLGSKGQSADYVATQCMANALREWFFYGKDHFEHRFEQMVEVARRMGWEHAMPADFWDSYEVREARWLTQNNVDKDFESQGWVSQSHSAAFMRNICAYNKPKNMVLPIKIHDVQSTYADPFEEELLLSKPKEFRVLAQEYVFNKYAGDFLIAFGKDHLVPRLLCVELKSRQPNVAYRQATRLARFTASWFDLHDTRLPTSSSNDATQPVVVYSVGITPDGYFSDITDPEIESLMETWYNNFIERCGDTRSDNTK